ncbi:hypothetical protein ACLOJK_024293, partial [Asimina triloba]
QIAGAPYDGALSSSMSHPSNPSPTSSNRMIRFGQKDGSPHLLQIRWTSLSTTTLQTIQAVGSSVIFLHAPTDGVLHGSIKSSDIGDRGRSMATNLHLQQLRPLDGCVMMNTATMAARSGDPSLRTDHSSKTQVLPTAHASSSAPIGRRFQIWASIEFPSHGKPITNPP